MHLQQIDVTGCRLVGAITKELGMDGPKHHAVVLGRSTFDGEVYIAELMDSGYQVTTYMHFHNRYAPNGTIRLEPNNGPNNNVQVAQRAIAELRQAESTYDLVVNNCESFVNRAMHGKSSSSQVAHTALGVVALVGLFYVLKNSK
ncbi:lecithin retinol acyltransferase family protein [Janthinobacterium sp. SUN120]|uniref:lecithin retinol acyltransferase family protein n=1 Tax=Janthinobacterium sp. SUN120 TaxID=3004099 RepID=UPI0025B1C6CA|nr:lecithin retinol acyltransferase family protein [Janthinobacterium sp. SUN120]MDN2713704.1 lecithin retinol acyltransferase family protein [Janthinobacterium sp. SUN120]